MHFSWEKHLELSLNVAVASDKNKGFALALMGVALTLLAKDLLAHELQTSPVRHPARRPELETEGDFDEELSARGWLLWRELSCWLKSDKPGSEEINLVLVGFIFLGLNPQC